MITALSLILLTTNLLGIKDTDKLWSNPDYNQKHVKVALGIGITSLLVGFVLVVLMYVKNDTTLTQSISSKTLKLFYSLNDLIAFITLNIVFFSLKDYTEGNFYGTMVVLYVFGSISFLATAFLFYYTERRKVEKAAALQELQDVFDRIR